MILMDPVLADIYLTQQLKASPKKRGGTMSRKERRDAIKSLLGIIKRHEADWTKERTINYFCFQHGYTKKKAVEYLGELVIAGLVTVSGENVYIKEQESAEKEVPEK